MNIPKIEQMQSSRGGRPNANQYRVFTDGGVAFQSYTTVIAFKSHDGTVTLDESAWDYSRTTSRYRNVFLRETTKDTERKIKSGEYKLANLNQ